MGITYRAIATPGEGTRVYEVRQDGTLLGRVFSSRTETGETRWVARPVDQPPVMSAATRSRAARALVGRAS